MIVPIMLFIFTIISFGGLFSSIINWRPPNINDVLEVVIPTKWSEFYENYSGKTFNLNIPYRVNIISNFSSILRYLISQNG